MIIILCKKNQYTTWHSLLTCAPVLQVFFVIRLQTQQAAQNLPPISDPDPHMSCELMDGRDNLLTMARDKHYEFSSLRRAKFSSIALLYELHNQGKESFVYTCNTCEAQVETRWHCQVCTVSTSLHLLCTFLIHCSKTGIGTNFFWKEHSRTWLC